MKWSYFPQNQKISEDLLNIVSVFDKNNDKISSDIHKLSSNNVLEVISADLNNIGYIVETGKRNEDKIQMPVLYGECGVTALNFEVDAYNKDSKIVIEVEAGRAVTNYQFLKDFFEACCMADAEYLCIAVRIIYAKRYDYQKVCDFFKAMYASNRFTVPLKGILIVGY